MAAGPRNLKKNQLSEGCLMFADISGFSHLMPSRPTGLLNFDLSVHCSGRYVWPNSNVCKTPPVETFHISTNRLSLLVANTWPSASNAPENSSLDLRIGFGTVWIVRPLPTSQNRNVAS